MDKASKPWDRARPFQPINSPSFVVPKTAPPGTLDGDGHKRGTRRPEDFLSRSVLDVLVVSELLRVVPSWVTTFGNTEDAAENEVYGKLSRSFQTWTDFPTFQWHRWYDWNFHIVPEPEFAWLRSGGNHDAKEGELDPIKPSLLGSIPVIGILSSKITGRNQHVVTGHTMELEWDTGAIGIGGGPTALPGLMFENDWAWPMTGDFVWAVGRSIYDGGHEFDNEDASTKGAVPKQTRSELHPCKALASTRFEAFKFPENGHFVPAIQFMFFTSRFGGYVDYPNLRPRNGKDYEFIVDLPETPDATGPDAVAIGHTAEFPLNTIVLRQPELLKHFEFERFFRARGRPPFDPPTNPPEDLKPLVELLEPSDPNPRRRQVKITIPMATIVSRSAEFYGVIISLGWSDPAGQQAAKVKKCTVKFKNLRKGSIDHDTFKEEWRFKAGVNGRWRQWQLGRVSNNKDHDLIKQHPDPIVFHLHEDDTIRISTHGAEIDLVDDVYTESSFEGRTIRVDPSEVTSEALAEESPPAVATTGAPPGAAAAWKGEIDPQPPRSNPNTSRQAFPLQRAIVRKVFSRLFTTFGDQNEPLGLIDPGRGSNREKLFNPLKIKDRNGEQDFALKGYFTFEKGDTAELLERPHASDADANNSGFIDYKLEYSVKIEPQSS